MPASTSLSRPLTLLLMPILGPILFLPLWAWRTLHRFVPSRALWWAALTPGAYALAAFAAVTLLRLAGSPQALLRADVLARYSPLNAAVHDVALLLQQMAVLSPMEAASSLVATWVVVAGTCTVFLSPIYAALLRRDEALSNV